MKEGNVGTEWRSRREFLRQLGTVAVGCRLAAAQTGAAASRSFNVRDWGGVGDGTALETKAMQRAIDEAAKRGGVVRVPAGRYVTGTLLLQSGVTLHLDEGATLLGSLNPADYQLVESFTDGVGAARGYALIGAVDAHGVGISGAGTIDGRGAELQAAGGKGPAARPFLALFVRSRAVAVSGVRLVNSSAWTMHLFQCANVTIDDVSIRSLGLANNDGIDVDSSTGVRITGCTIESGDDAICLKTTSALPCRDITVEWCTMTTRCAAFKIGTESVGDFSAIRVSDCHVIVANLGAVKILSVDGAHISGVLVERMQVDDADTPVFLRLGARGSVFRAGDAARPPGTISGVVIRDVVVQRARRIGVLISGIPEHTIENVTLERVAITMADGAGEVVADPPEKPAAYPEVRMFGAALPAYGVYARHATAIKLIDVKVSAAPGETRPERIIVPGA